MKITDIFENDAEHSKALDSTGYWGKKGAGCIVYASNTGRILFPRRSSMVQEPMTWGVFGGAIDSNEDPRKAAARELEEEAGKKVGFEQLRPLYVFNDESVGFTYFNFIAVVEDEFDPELNWENEGFKWVEFGEWPSPLHFGVQKILADEKAMLILKEICGLAEEEVENEESEED